jgi:hypothetical protein
VANIQRLLAPMAIADHSDRQRHQFVFFAPTPAGRLQVWCLVRHKKKPPQFAQFALEISVHALARLIQFHRIRDVERELAPQLQWVGAALYSRQNAAIPLGDEVIFYGPDVEPVGHFVHRENTLVTFVGERSYTESQRRHMRRIIQEDLAA